MKKRNRFWIVALVTVLAPAISSAKNTKSLGSIKGSFPTEIETAYPEMKKLVTTEYSTEQTGLQTRLDSSRISIKGIKSDRKRVVAQSIARARHEIKGVKLFLKYVRLLKVRYVDDNGKHRAGLQLAKEDVKKINKLYQKYLSKIPLADYCSVGVAARTLVEGSKILENLANLHNEPSRKNNSELSILAKRERDATKKIDVVLVLADRLGVKLENKVTTSGTTRTPASKTSVTKPQN